MFAALAVLYSGLWLLSGSFLIMPVTAVIASGVLAAALIALSVVDLRSFRIPDGLNLGIAVSGIVVTLTFTREAFATHVVAALLAGLALAAMNFVYASFRKRQALGMGDMKLIAAGTLWVGPPGVLSVLLWSSVTGLLHFLVKRVMGTELNAGTRIPFGPHVALGIWLVWLFGPVML